MKLLSPMHRRLFNYLRPYLFPYTALLGVSMLVLAGANAGIPFVIKNFVNDMTRTQGAGGLHVLSFMLAGLFLLRAGGNLTDDYLSAYITQKLVLDMRADLNESLQRQSLSFFNRTPTGMMVSRVLNDVNVVVQTLSNGVFSLFGDGLSLVALIGAAFYMDWQLALVAFVGFPLTIGPIVSFSKRVRKETKNAQKQLGGLQALLQETFQGNRVVKAFGMEDYERRRFNAELRRLFPNLHARGADQGDHRTDDRVARRGGGGGRGVVGVPVGRSRSAHARIVRGIFHHDAVGLCAVQIGQQNQQHDPAGARRGRTRVRNDGRAERCARRSRRDRAGGRTRTACASST